MAAFLNSLPEKQLSAMADTYVEGYIRGFSVMGLSFEKKNIVSIRYPIGFERMIQIAIKRLEQIGKEVTIHIRAISLAGRIQGRRELSCYVELSMKLNLIGSDTVGYWQKQINDVKYMSIAWRSRDKER